jgi:hypothetical protein
MLRRFLLIILFFNLALTGFSQATFKVSGVIINQEKEQLEGVRVKIQDQKNTILTNNNGAYSLNLKPGYYILNFSYLGFKSINVEVKVIDKDIDLSITLQKDLQQLKQVVVEDQQARNTGMISVNSKLASTNPNVSQSFESILKQLPGVSTNNELSSQYSVRGGNFDENLIYINDIEIYKPYLVRNGQQEGLSLINPDLVGNVKFSAGGFGAKYGDKLSSVLDVTYKTFDTTQVIVGLATNGVSATTFFNYKKVNLALAYRNKKNTSVLNSQPVIGNYNPQFNDFQGLLNWKISDKTSLNFLGIYNSSKFGLVPESRETEFGTFNQLLRLSVNYEGQEQDEFTNIVSSATLNSQISKNSNLKWINSLFLITEKENFDILGSYIFNEIDNDFGSSNFGQVKANRGIGAYQNYGRNELRADVFSSDLKFNFTHKKNYWETGFRFQYDKIADVLKEFELIDSAGFSIPNTFNNFQLSQSVDAQNSLNTTRISAYAQNTGDINDKISYTGGIRLNFNNFTNEILISPRLVMAYRPNTEKDLIYRFAAGFYAQPPFYRELRDFNGIINQNAKSQKSLHFVLSSDYNFKGLGTNMRFSAEAYYKNLYNLTPYNLENLRLRYYADQTAKGFATGLDFSLSGEFVKDLESNFRLSLMKTAEDINGDSYIQTNEDGSTQVIFPGYIKRPTDQRVNFSAFFQDKLFNSPTFKVHMNLLYGGKLPTGPPNSPRYQQVYRIPAYKRFDIGFSKDILDPESTHKPRLLDKYFKSFIIYAEIFNAVNINNTVSYLWVTDVNNIQFAIPNYLTARQLNLRLIVKF